VNLVSGKISNDRERWRAVGYKFSLVLSREITDDESAILQEVSCPDVIFATDTLPTDADVIVTKMDFDDTRSPSLAEAIESGLEAVKKVPDLSVPGLTVPAQPERIAAEEPEKVIQGVVVQDKPGARKSSARKPGARKSSARKPGAGKSSAASAPEAAAVTANGHAATPVSTANGHAATPESGAGSSDDAVDPEEAPAGSG
jgi:hypothetical protein